MVTTAPFLLYPRNVDMGKERFQAKFKRSFTLSVTSGHTQVSHVVADDDGLARARVDGQSVFRLVPTCTCTCTVEEWGVRLQVIYDAVTLN